MSKPVLSKEEIASLKATRKVLKKLSAKHKKLVDAAWARKGEYDPTDVEDFEDLVYKQAKVDFYEDDQAFIRL